MADSILDNQMFKTALLVLAVAMIVYLLSSHFTPSKSVAYFNLDAAPYEPFGSEIEPYDDDEGMEMFEDEDGEMFDEEEDFDENENDREFFDEENEEFADEDVDAEEFDDDYLEEFDDEDDM